MINPGSPNYRLQNPNLPTTSGVVPGANGMLSTQLVSIDGFKLTLGLVVLALVLFWLFNTFARKR